MSKVPDESTVRAAVSLAARAGDLADIAVQSAASAAALGIEPRVAMISSAPGHQAPVSMSTR